METGGIRQVSKPGGATIRSFIRKASQLVRRLASFGSLRQNAEEPNYRGHFGY